MGDQKKGRKFGRMTKNPSHVRAKSEDRTECNKVRREIRNLKDNPNDKDCLSRLSNRESTGNIPWRMMSTLKSFLADFRKERLA